MDRASLDQFYREIYQQLYGHSPALEDYFARQQAYAKCILALYAEELPSVADVLEVGCGASGALAVFQREGHRVAGCELSQEQLAYGTQQGVIDLWHGTIDDAPANIFQRRFDLIFLHHVFEHLPSPRETLFALGSWLKPTGRILIIVPDITRVDCFPNPAGDILRFLHVAHKYNFTAGCLQIVAAHAGLHAVSKRPPSHLKTDWSQMPELWMEFRPAEVTCKAPASGCDSGSMVLQYLLATEQRFLAGDFLAPGATHGVAAQVATPQRNVVARLWHWAKRRAVKKAA